MEGSQNAEAVGLPRGIRGSTYKRDILIATVACCQRECGEHLEGSSEWISRVLLSSKNAAPKRSPVRGRAHARLQDAFRGPAKRKVFPAS